MFDRFRLGGEGVVRLRHASASHLGKANREQTNCEQGREAHEQGYLASLSKNPGLVINGSLQCAKALVGVRAQSYSGEASLVIKFVCGQYESLR
jgi:hypothetical protein